MADEGETPASDGENAEAGESEPFIKLDADEPVFSISIGPEATFGLASAEFKVEAAFKGEVSANLKSLEIASLVALQLESALPLVLKIEIDNGESIELPLSAFFSKTGYAALNAQKNEVTAGTLTAKATELRAVMKELGSELNEADAYSAMMEQDANRQVI